MKILIPTCKPDVSDVEHAILQVTPDAEIIASKLERKSASINRNYCLSFVEHGEVAIMIDDDISGFYEGWQHDLCVSLMDDAVVMASARLLTPQGLVAQTCSMCYDLEPEEIEIIPHTHCVLPTAAIALRHRGITFDEQYKGSGWEDNDWCRQYLVRDPSCKFIQSNRCRLIHANEMKNQGGPNWIWNKGLYEWKWLRGESNDRATA